MKPLKITMTAFGPYKNREVIDFSELGNHRLFVVSGKTGAGKTTIFDAICYALYGEASGEERQDVQLLRSHFAREDVHTSVELDFVLNGRKYRVFRQMPHVKPGNKTATGARCEFYDITDGSAVPFTDRFYVKEINEKIEQLIGLTKDQFSQIVMLPQGEFRKLLTSETENKEEILRRIFKTGLYKQLAERFNERRKEAEQQYGQKLHERQVVIHRIRGGLPRREDSLLFSVLDREQYNVYQLSEALDEEADFYQKEAEKHQRAWEEARMFFEKKTAAYHEGKSLDDTFRNLDAKRQKKKDLDLKAPEMERWQRRLEQAEKAERLETHEQYVREVEREKRDKQKADEQARSEWEKAELELSEAKAVYDREETNADQREQAARELDRLCTFVEEVQDLEKKKKELQKLQDVLSRQSGRVQQLTAKVEEKKKEKSRIAVEIEKLEKETEELPEKQEQLLHLREQAKKLKNVVDAQEKVQERSQDASDKRQQYEEAQKAYEAEEEKWLEGQAALLADHLVDGRPCPVCGSTEHPNKAYRAEDVPSREALERLRKTREKTEEAYRTAYARWHSQKDELQKYVQAVQEGDFSGSEDDYVKEYERMVASGQELKQRVDELLQKREQLKQHKLRRNELEREWEALEQQKSESDRQLQETKTDVEKKRVLYEKVLQQIPQDLRQSGQLQKRIRETEEQKRRLENAWKAAQDRMQLAKEKLVRARTRAENATSARNEAEEKLKKARRLFLEGLQKEGFSDTKAYEHAKMPEAEREALKQKIEVYDQERAALAAQIKGLEEELRGRTRPDVEALQQEMRRWEEKKDAAREAWQNAVNDGKEIARLKKELLETDERVKQAEQDVERITDLYNVVRGDNPKRISFERYLQIEFLEQIIHAANERLRRLSNGHFYLMRSDRLEKRGKQSGLGLDVYDAYTGQTRDVKSLSGGEKFNASLCLALGMADVIQAFEGGVSIETMFIDEGFGALDEESLTRAIDTLIDLQKSGRVVGVISHIQELKSAIPAVLEVHKTKEGHSHTRFVFR